ncbi:unnamed protein product [Meganyctiphanes norvegica]|uniref:RING-type domain-containing protein n=1 Tax=Meganyctiphanes norvegica TaxID=48144 RepID=A0AAV2RLE6_MEGNR
MADSKECPTCYEEYDSEEHRIRIIQCGHSQCTSCMEAQFSNGRITCATCRTTFKYTDFNRIPVNFVAEKMKEDLEKLTPKQHKGMCTEHAAYKLFWCNTHHEWICHQCSVADHPRGECDVISLTKKLENDKDFMKSNLTEEIRHLDNTNTEVKRKMNEFDQKIKKEKDQIKKMNEEIDKLKKSILQKEKEVAVINVKHSKLYKITKECRKKKAKLRKCVTHVKEVNSFKQLELESEKSAAIINRYDNWKQEFEEDKEISLVMQQIVKKRKMFVTKSIGSSKYHSPLEKRDAGIFISYLQPKVSPVQVKFDDVMLMQPLVYLKMICKDFNTRTLDISLGCLHIQLEGPPRRVQQFLELSTGSNTRGTYRGVKLSKIWARNKPGERVAWNAYSKGFRQKMKPLFKLEETGQSPLIEGNVYGLLGQHAGFGICLTSCPDVSCHAVVIGRVVAGLPELKSAVHNQHPLTIMFSDTGIVFPDIG